MNAVSSEVATARIGVDTAEPYNQQDILSLMVGSFRFSRGSPRAQESIFSYLAYFYGDRLDSSLVSACSRPLAQIAINYIGRGGHIDIDSSGINLSQDKIKKETDRQIKIFRDIIAYSTFSIDDMSRSLIVADDNALPEARRNRLPDALPTEYVSNLVRYGLMGRGTGREEFDQMFQGVINDILGPYDFRKDEIAEIIRRHLKENPDDTQAVELRLRSVLAPHLST